MKIKYDIEKLNKLLCDLSSLLGISMVVLDSNLNPLVSYKSEDSYCGSIKSFEKGEKLCTLSDAAILKACKKSLKLETHICHAGLCDAAMPILKGGIIVGYVLLGRIRVDQSFDSAAKKISWYGGDINLLKRQYQQLQYFSNDRIESLRSLLSYVIFDSTVEIEQEDLITRINEYIDNNLKCNITVEKICGAMGVSKNILYRCFNEYHNKTFCQYIIDKRIDLAKDMLAKTKQPIYSIAEDVGIDNYTYFCKLFKKKTGVSPVKYRTINSDKN